MRYRLNVIGITYNQIESGVYALVLEAEGTDRRIPIIIGAPEAQAIECKLQNVVTSRPLTHDMITNLLDAFHLQLKEIEIRKLPTGVFAADLVMTDGIEERRIDSRSSDAVALAIRVGAPIYTSAEVLREAGFDSDSADGSRRQSASPRITPLEECPEDELRELMRHAVDREDYETAAEIKRELERRNDESEENDI